MKTLIALGLVLASLGSRAEPEASVERRDPACGVFPITRHMWTKGYRDILQMPGAPVMHEAYVAIGTFSWVLATPFFALSDLVAYPFRAPCPAQANGLARAP
ncbi:hypothetical protein [Candidatus Methylocalor cossyra]|uniref:hypothetical protein n=1 Tax=Candidatus Methylocalor cossyra TaxID=3108543 RepID=UPI0032B12A65